jgi:Cytochrome P460
MVGRVRLASLVLLAVALTACGGAPADERDAGGEPRATTAASGTDAATAEEPALTEPGPPEPSAEPLPGLPRWTAGYRRWTKLNATPLPPRESDPHLGTKDVYASRAPTAGVYPVGTVVVKEAMRPGRDFVGLVAAMRKVAGADPEHNDWVFVEWTRDAEAERFSELARGAVCTSCHVGVADQDYVFTRD